MKYSSLLLLPVILQLIFCATKIPLFTKAIENEARILKSYCAEQKITSQDRNKADALFTTATGNLNNEDYEQAYFYMELAVVKYRQTLLKKDINQNQKRISDLKLSLEDDNEQLETYKKVFEELKELRNVK